MDIRAAEISSILKDQIANFGTEAEVAETKAEIEQMRKTGELAKIINSMRLNEAH